MLIIPKRLTILEIDSMLGEVCITLVTIIFKSHGIDIIPFLPETGGDATHSLDHSLHIVLNCSSPITLTPNAFAFSYFDPGSAPSTR